MHKYSFFSNQKNEIKKDKNGFDVCKKRINKTIIKKFYSKEYGLDLVLMFSIRIKNREKAETLCKNKGIKKHNIKHKNENLKVIF
jgi:hypothetical protein